MRAIGISTTFHAESAKGAKKDRFTVASHLVCDVGVSNRASEASSDATAGRFTPYGADGLRPRRTATAADAMQTLLGAINHEVRQGKV